MENGRSSPAKPTVITKIQRSAKPTTRNFPTTSGNMSSRPAKPERSPSKTKNYLSSATAKKKNKTKSNSCCPKRVTSFSEKGSKAGSSFITTPPAKSMQGSTDEIM